MKILHTVQFYYPSIGGMQEVVRQISERFVKMGHEVTVATTKLTNRTQSIINGVRIIEFEIFGYYFQGFTGEVKLYQDYIINSNFDVIVNFAAQQWATDLCLPILDQIRAKKVFVPTGFSGLYRREYRPYFEQMPEWLKKYDINVFHSNDYRDINFARDNGIQNTILIPNGAGSEEFLSPDIIDIKAKLKIPDDHFLIIHVGSHTGVKGHKEAIKIFKKARIYHTTFLIIGNFNDRKPQKKKTLLAWIKHIILILLHRKRYNCPEYCLNAAEQFNQTKNALHHQKKLLLYSLSREETVSAYRQADLFLFPSNIECSPIVLFEALATKTPFLTSDVGNAREIIQWTNGGKLLPSVKNKIGYCSVKIKASTKILEKIFYNREDRMKYIRDGFASWQKRFTWEIIAQKYADLYQDLLKGVNINETEEISKSN